MQLPPCSRKYTPGCPCPHGCKVWWENSLSRWRSLDPICGSPLRGFRALRAELQPEVERSTLNICQNCRKRIAELLDAARQYIWDELPYAFSVKQKEKGVVYGYESYLCVFTITETYAQLTRVFLLEIKSESLIPRPSKIYEVCEKYVCCCRESHAPRIKLKGTQAFRTARYLGDCVLATMTTLFHLSSSTVVDLGGTWSMQADK